MNGGPGRYSALGLLLLFTCLSSAAERPPTRAEAVERLEQSLARMRQIAETPPDATPAQRLGAADLRTELIALQQIEALYLTEGQSVDMPVEWGWASLYLGQGRLDRELRSQVARQAIRQLHYMLDLMSWPRAPGTTDLGRMERILRRQEYAYAEQEESAYAALVRRLRALVHRLFSRFSLEADQPALRMAYQFIFIILLVGIAGTAGWLIYTRWPRRKRAAAPPPESSAEALPDAAELARRKADAQRAGRLREALHFAYLALVVALSERQVVPALAGRTNWEILRLLARERAGSPALPRLESVNRLYDRVWYGQEPYQDTEVLSAFAELDYALTELSA